MRGQVEGEAVVDVINTDRRRRPGEQREQREIVVVVEGRHVTVIDRPSCSTWS